MVHTNVVNELADSHDLATDYILLQQENQALLQLGIKVRSHEPSSLSDCAYVCVRTYCMRLSTLSCFYMVVMGLTTIAYICNPNILK